MYCSVPSSPAPSSAPGYSIRLVSEITGIGIETLRQWERRYGFPSPARNAGGARVYDEDTVHTLKLLARALKHGYRPGALVGHSRDDIERALDAVETSAPEPVRASSVDEIVDALIADDVLRMTTLLRDAALVYGARRFVTELASDLVRRVGELWEEAELEVRHEHLLSDVLTTQLRVLRASYSETRRGPTIVFATLPGEMHGLGIEMVAVYLAAAGANVRVVGVNTPVDQIVKAATGLGAKAVGISIAASADATEATTELARLGELLPRKIQLWIGGEGAERARFADPRVRLVRDWVEIDAALDRL